MVYLLGFLFKWLAHALVPTVILLVVGALVMLGVWRCVLRPRRLSPAKGWILLALVTVAFGAWRTWEFWQAVSRPGVHMFREFVANPIPKEVRGLASATAGPAMFHDGAYISFHAPPDVVERIVNHSLPGSQTAGVIRQMKRRSGRDTADRTVIAAADGQSYLKVDAEWLANEKSPETDWARHEVGNFLKGRDGSAYVLLWSGDWGSFLSVMEHEPARERVVIKQYLTRR